MLGAPDAERTAIVMTYEDTATITRTISETGGNSITKRVPAVVYENIRCALSLSGSDTSKQTKQHNTVDYAAVLFAAPELSILPGDKITLWRLGADNPDTPLLAHFTAVGRPRVYATHQEIKVTEGDLA